MSAPVRPDDPLWPILQHNRSKPETWSSKRVHRDGCYICEDREFEILGLPLCRPCPRCGESADPKNAGHIAADDSVCDVCGFDDSDPDAEP